MLHMHEYPQPQAFSCLRHDSTSLLSRYGGFGIRSHDGPPKGTWEKHKSVEVRRCVDAQGHIVEFYEKTECHKDTSQLLMLETQPSSGGG